MANIEVAITKAKSTLSVDTSVFSDEMFEYIVARGLRDILNGGMSKVTAKDIPNEEDRKAEAMVIAAKRLEELVAGTLKRVGGKVKKASGAVMTEARRLAKALVKDAIKASGGKISHYEASEITKAANALLETPQGKDILAQAEANLAERSKTPIGIDIGGLIKPSEKLVAKAKADNEKKKSTLSAKQAGMPAKAKKSPSAQANA